MENKKLMEKVIDLDTQFLKTREQSTRVMVQIAIIRKAFGVKNDETNKPVKNYERKLVLSDDDIRKEFNDYVRFWEWAKEKNDMDKAKEFENQIYYFIEAVRFFNVNLADKFQAIQMKNKQKLELKTLVSNMINEYRGIGKFSQGNLEQIIHLADFQEHEVSKLINKFHYINTKIVDDGGMPVLKEIYSMI